MKDMIRSSSQQGVCRHSRAAQTQAGERRSKALLWSINKTARPPGVVDRPSSSGGPRALEIGPSRADWSWSLGAPSRSDRAWSVPRRPSKCRMAS
eukprot:2971477-Alexandrium_andersonii.AAC.1